MKAKTHQRQKGKTSNLESKMHKELFRQLFFYVLFQLYVVHFGWYVTTYQPHITGYELHSGRYERHIGRGKKIMRKIIKNKIIISNIFLLIYCIFPHDSFDFLT